VYSTRGQRNAAYVMVDHPNEALAVAGVLRERAAADTVSPTIRSVETLQDRFPMQPATQAAKLARIAHIRNLLGDPFLASSDSDYLALLVDAAGTTAPIRDDEIPDFIRRPFTSKQGELGTLVIVYPIGSLADGRRSMQFADDVGVVRTPDGRTYHAGSTSIVASDMLRLMQDESPVMIGLTVLLIVLFKIIILRRLRWVLLALVPLASSFMWMFGIMALFDFKLNFYNLVVLPTVLGIGDDSGIHIVHRYLEEGPGSIRRVLRSTGEHITMSAMTTIVGFGGLLFSMHPGMRSLGTLAVLGISMTLIAALAFLPALLTWMEKPAPRLSVEAREGVHALTEDP
ncbi:MAG: MMPL family transporter, partial [Rhodothermales bacterium]